MSFQINRGLFTLDMSDYHAILGVSVEADVKEIRKQYLKIARRLHPDSCRAESNADRQAAEQLLSKLVNPAWEKLAQEKNRIEQVLMLKLKGKAAARKRRELNLGSGLAQQLLSASNPDSFYRNALRDLTERQFDHLDQVLEITAQISELNLAYLVMKDDGNETTTGERSTYTGAAASSTPAPSKTPTKVVPAPQESLADQYFRRAESFANRGNYTQATLELRDALKLEPNHSRCHSLMGMVYLRQNQATMAKIHFNKALAIDPNDVIALDGKQKVDAATTSQSAAKSANKNDRTDKSANKTTLGKATPAKPNDGKSGGLFGGLFGGKKK